MNCAISNSLFDNDRNGYLCLSNFFMMATSTNIEYIPNPGGVFELPLNALVLLPFILFRNIQRGIEREGSP